MLLEQDAMDVNKIIEESNRHTALHIAAMRGYRCAAVYILAKRRRQLAQHTRFSDQHLLSASHAWVVFLRGLVELLLKHKVDVTMSDVNQNTALHLALSDRNHDIAKVHTRIHAHMHMHVYTRVQCEEREERGAVSV
jgi:ankyrin repeat protein